MELRQQNRYLQAANIYSEVYRKAKDRNERLVALRSLSNLGNCRFVAFKYREAMEAFLESRRLAEELGDWESAGAISNNIASLYAEMNDESNAVQAAERGLRDLERVPATKYRAQILLQLANLKIDEGGAGLFYRAIDEADRQNDTALEAQGWDLLGYRMLQAGRLAEAERALYRAFRLRLLTHDPDLGSTYRTLAMLRLAQGDWKSASRLAAAALETDRIPDWTSFYLRGRIRMAAKSTGAALEDFRVALDLARRIRLDAVPANSVRVGMDVALSQLYTAFIQAAATLYFETGRTALMREAFEAAEENRAASLRAALLESHDRPRNLPAEYGEDLARLRTCEISLIRNPRPEERQLAARLRTDLTEMEARAGLASPDGNSSYDGAGLLYKRIRARLAADEALVSFHLAEPESYVWAVTREGMEIHRLPGAAAIAEAARNFSGQVRSGSPAAARSGSGLYREIFSKLSPRVVRMRHWTLALDGPLFQVPFPALVLEQGGGSAAFLAERHSVEIVPGAYFLLASKRARPAHSARLIAIGDPVYNSADPRWRGRPWGDSDGIGLARLAGSGREIRSCAQVWGGNTELVEGAAVSASAVRRAVESGPAILHLATHVYSGTAIPGQGMIALGLAPEGRADFLDSSAIATWRTTLGLVVLSGCSSGAAEALPGAGLMGLTRSWLAAGAGSVMASLWPTPDDTGEFFRSFYRHLRENAGTASSEAVMGLAPARALERAQLDMLRSGTWRSQPKYWAAYFLVGKE